MMKTTRLVSLLVGTVALMTLDARAQTPKPPNSVQLEYKPTLTVTGHGETFATPDRATVRLGAQAQAKDAATAQKEVNQTMAKALAAVKKLGVEEKFVQTMGLNLFPVYAQQRSSRIEPENQEPRIAGYRAENTIQVTLNDLGLVGKVIDAGIDAGLNRLEGVSFDLRNDTPQRQEALIHAIEEARAKAQVMAPALGVKLGDLREVFEEGSAAPPRPLNFRAERFAMAASDTPVQPGQMRIEASVTLRYEIIRRD